MTTQTQRTILIVDQDMNSRGRLRECLRHTLHRATLTIARSEREALQLLENLETPFDIIFLSTCSGADSVLNFFQKVRELHTVDMPAIIVILKGEQVDSSFISELYLQGVNGFLKEPFSSVKLLELLQVLESTEASELSEQQKNEAAAGFLIGDAMRYIDQASRKIAAGEQVNQFAMQKLSNLSERIGEISGKISDLFGDILVKKLSSAPTPKELPGKKKTAITTIDRVLPHPAFVVREMLQERRLSKQKFLEMLNIDPDQIEQFLILQADMDETLAIELSRILGREPKFWLDLQRKYNEQTQRS